MKQAPTPDPPLAEILEFMGRNARMPRLGDARPPWRYRGWLLPYVIMLHTCYPAAADRWGYYLRTLVAGSLLNEQIPPILFGSPGNQVLSLLHGWSTLIGRDCGGWSDFRMLLDWLAWGLALSSEEVALSDNTHEKLYRQVNLAPLLKAPHDYLGAFVAMNRARGWNPTGFYPTPHAVVECLVRLTMADLANEDRDSRTQSVCDPCMGSGRMLLHASNYSLRLYGQDIDPLCVTMCLINGALYAPWLSYPLPVSIVSQELPSDLTVCSRSADSDHAHLRRGRPVVAGVRQRLTK